MISSKKNQSEAVSDWFLLVLSCILLNLFDTSKNQLIFFI